MLISCQFPLLKYEWTIVTDWWHYLKQKHKLKKKMFLFLLLMPVLISQESTRLRHLVLPNLSYLRAETDCTFCICWITCFWFIYYVLLLYYHRFYYWKVYYNVLEKVYLNIKYPGFHPWQNQWWQDKEVIQRWTARRLQKRITASVN